MKEFVNDIQNLIVKHWGKLIVITIIVTLLINYKDVYNGSRDGWNSVDYYMKQFYTGLIFNLILMILSIALIKTLYSNHLIDKSTRNTLTLFSVLVPIGGLITTVLKCRRMINHLARVKEMK